MRPPCEIVVQKILPAIRAELARILLEEGLPQQQVAISSDTERQIRELAKSLAGDLRANDAVGDLCAVCKGIQSSGWLCKEL